MAKNYSKCALCKAKRLLNFAGLCKRCNQMAESSKISGDAMNVKQEKLKAQNAMQGQRSEDDHERQVLLEKDELTLKQKEKILELSPDMESIAEVDTLIEKMRAEKNEKGTDSDKKDEK
jgi:hypothetical protein